MGTELIPIITTVGQKQIIYSESLILRADSRCATLMIEDVQLHLILEKGEKDLIRAVASEKEVTITLSPSQSMYLEEPVFFATLGNGENIYLDLVASRVAEGHYVVTVNLNKERKS